MNVCVIGLGSMGRRRIRLLSEIRGVNIVGVDTNETRCVEAQKQFGISTCSSLQAAVKSRNFECAFISTSPLSHSKLIHDCLEAGMHVFTEINLVSDGYEDNIRLAKERGLVLFLSSTFLYRDETEYMIQRVKESSGPVHYNYHVGQYLSDWHPWENYKDFFVHNPRTNGCREIMAIEFPWITSCFSRIKNINVLKGKSSQLQIDYPDHYFLLLQHDSGTVGSFIVDLLSRKAIRKLDIFGEDLFMSWNGTPDSVTDYDLSQKADRKIQFTDASERADGYASFITENPYRKEITTFLEQIKFPEKTVLWDFERDYEIMKVIDQIEES